MNEDTFNFYVIECSTGCSCCSHENHTRGPYKTEEEAQRRVRHFQEGEYWPLVSQFARRGKYFIDMRKAEAISNGRFILDDETVHHGPFDFIEVKLDGSVEDNDAERMGSYE